MGSVCCSSCGAQTSEFRNPCGMCEGSDGLCQPPPISPAAQMAMAVASWIETSNPPKPKSRWKHAKNGDTYEVICVSNLSATETDWVPTVVYVSLTTGQVWSRPLADWTPERYKRAN